MVSIVFKKRSGSYRPGQKCDFNDKLADFFVSKIKVAEYSGFDDLIGEETPLVVAPKNVCEQTKPVKRKPGRPKKSEYLTRELKAEA